MKLEIKLPKGYRWLRASTRIKEGDMYPDFRLHSWQPLIAGVDEWSEPGDIRPVKKARKTK